MVICAAVKRHGRFGKGREAKEENEDGAGGHWDPRRTRNWTTQWAKLFGGGR